MSKHYKTLLVFALLSLAFSGCGILDGQPGATFDRSQTVRDYPGGTKETLTETVSRLLLPRDLDSIDNVKAGPEGVGIGQLNTRGESVADGATKWFLIFGSIALAAAGVLYFLFRQIMAAAIAGGVGVILLSGPWLFPPLGALLVYVIGAGIVAAGAWAVAKFIFDVDLRKRATAATQKLRAEGYHHEAVAIERIANKEVDAAFRRVAESKPRSKRRG